MHITEGSDKTLHVKYENSGEAGDKGKVPIVQASASDHVFVNPCSYEPNEAVLRSIGIAKYGTGDRQWLTVFCDGSPYTLCSRIIQSTYRCDQCQVSVSGLDHANSHILQHHAGQ